MAEPTTIDDPGELMMHKNGLGYEGMTSVLEVSSALGPTMRSPGLEPLAEILRLLRY